MHPTHSKCVSDGCRHIWYTLYMDKRKVWCTTQTNCILSDRVKNMWRRSLESMLEMATVCDMHTYVAVGNVCAKWHALRRSKKTKVLLGSFSTNKQTRIHGEHFTSLQLKHDLHCFILEIWRQRSYVLMFPYPNNHFTFFITTNVRSDEFCIEYFNEYVCRSRED